jgi:hypothetical protein
MQLITQNNVEELFSRLVTDVNHSIYEPRLGNDPFKKKPHVMYFYYFGFKTNGIPDIQHYYRDNGAQPIEDNQLPGVIRNLALNARDGGQSPPQIGKDFENILWRKKSYFVILIDSPSWNLIKDRALVFNPEKGSVPNHSFFDGEDFDIDVSKDGDGSEMRTAICCINHMKKNENGDDIHKNPDGTPERQRFVFTLIYNLLGYPSTVDPDGTNMGPPNPPPY